MAFLRNTWYIAAWAKEIGQGALFPRTLLNEPIVFYRKSDGSIAALSDRCPHRFAPLHTGTIKNDGIQCGYHGLEFDSSGQCAHNPHGDGSIPKAARVKAYPTIERHLAIWVWMGDAALADAAAIPDYSFLSAAKPGSRNSGYIHVKASYRLLCDNIMDLSHVDFLHPTTLGGGALSRTQGQVSEHEGKVRILWQTKNEVAPPSFKFHLANPDAPVDFWTDVIWSAPSLMHLSTGIHTSGTPKETELTTANLHMMTPETETTSHYFYANSRSFAEDDFDFNQKVDRLLTNVFITEDKPMVESQQRLMGAADLWSLNPVLLPVDAGAVRMRRVLDRLIQEESATASVVQKIFPLQQSPEAHETNRP